MQPISSAVEAREFEMVRKGGYDPHEVDAFMERVVEAALEFEEQLTAAHSKIHALERQIEGTKDAEQAVGIAFLAAADAKHNLIEDAEKKAAEIIERARARAGHLEGPRRELEEQRARLESLRADLVESRATAEAEADEVRSAARLEADRIREEAEASRTATDDEADRLLAAARRQAERIVTEARHDALAAIDESKREAEEWVQQARAEQQRVELMLRGLKAAVRDMLADATQRHEAIRVVLAEEDEETAERVRLPAG